MGCLKCSYTCNCYTVCKKWTERDHVVNLCSNAVSPGPRQLKSSTEHISTILDNSEAYKSMFPD